MPVLDDLPIDDGLGAYVLWVVGVCGSCKLHVMPSSSVLGTISLASRDCHVRSIIPRGCVSGK